jgi:hypothetical protein
MAGHLGVESDLGGCGCMQLATFKSENYNFFKLCIVYINFPQTFAVQI